MINNLKINNEEFENFGKELIEQFKDFRVVSLTGEVDYFLADWELKLSNGDVIKYFHRTFPYSSRKDIHWINFNGDVNHLSDSIFDNYIYNLHYLYTKFEKYKTQE